MGKRRKSAENENNKDSFAKLPELMVEDVEYVETLLKTDPIRNDASESDSGLDEDSIPDNTSFWSHLVSELTSSDFEGKIDSKSDRISNFLSVPFQIEKLMFIGYLVCLDSFLYIFTILPLRILIALYTIVRSGFR